MHNHIPDQEWHFRFCYNFPAIEFHLIFLMLSLFVAIVLLPWYLHYGAEDKHIEGIWLYIGIVCATVIPSRLLPMAYTWIRRRLHGLPDGGYLRFDNGCLHYHTLQNGQGSLNLADIKYIHVDIPVRMDWHHRVHIEYLLPQDKPDSADLRLLTLNTDMLYCPALHPSGLFRKPQQECCNDFAHALIRRCPPENLLSETEREILRHRDWLARETERSRQWLDNAKRNTRTGR